MNKTKLSILILTHNRPELFQRAISSVLSNLPTYPVEILVNNDSNDIEEIYSENIDIKYFYEQSHDLSDIYNFLYSSARGEFIYFLEDDDYLTSNFFNNIDYTYDVNFFEYVSEPLIRSIGGIHAYRTIAKNRDIAHNNDLKLFVSEFDDEEFQLGQILFRKNKIKAFPKGNNINNDYVLLQELANSTSTFKYIHDLTWVQTTDGKDNISFEDLNKDERFC